MDPGTPRGLRQRPRTSHLTRSGHRPLQQEQGRPRPRDMAPAAPRRPVPLRRRMDRHQAPLEPHRRRGQERRAPRHRRQVRNHRGHLHARPIARRPGSGPAARPAAGPHPHSASGRRRARPEAGHILHRGVQTQPYEAQWVAEDAAVDGGVGTDLRHQLQTDQGDFLQLVSGKITRTRSTDRRQICRGPVRLRSAQPTCATRSGARNSAGQTASSPYSAQVQ